jgi:hypothetical protein
MPALFIRPPAPPKQVSQELARMLDALAASDARERLAARLPGGAAAAEALVPRGPSEGEARERALVLMRAIGGRLSPPGAPFQVGLPEVAAAPAAAVGARACSAAGRGTPRPPPGGARAQGSHPPAGGPPRTVATQPTHTPCRRCP